MATKSEDMAGVNGVTREEEGPRRGKRKARKPAIKDESSDNSDTPLVSFPDLQYTRIGGFERRHSKFDLTSRGVLLT